MTETPTPQPIKTKSNSPVTMIKFVVALAVAVVAGTVLHYFLKQVMILNSMNILGIWVISFILSLSLKVNYQKLSFFIYLIVGTLLVSLYPFGQGLTIYLLLVFLGRWLKMI